MKKEADAEIVRQRNAEQARIKAEIAAKVILFSIDVFFFCFKKRFQYVIYFNRKKPNEIEKTKPKPNVVKNKHVSKPKQK